MLTINNFLFKAQIDNINLFKVVNPQIKHMQYPNCTLS